MKRKPKNDTEAALYLKHALKKLGIRAARNKSFAELTTSIRLGLIPLKPAATHNIDVNFETGDLNNEEN